MTSYHLKLNLYFFLFQTVLIIDHLWGVIGLHQSNTMRPSQPILIPVVNSVSLSNTKSDLSSDKSAKHFEDILQDAKHDSANAVLEVQNGKKILQQQHDDGKSLNNHHDHSIRNAEIATANLILNKDGIKMKIVESKSMSNGRDLKTNNYMKINKVTKYNSTNTNSHIIIHSDKSESTISYQLSKFATGFATATRTAFYTAAEIAFKGFMLDFEPLFKIYDYEKLEVKAIEKKAREERIKASLIQMDHEAEVEQNINNSSRDLNLKENQQSNSLIHKMIGSLNLSFIKSLFIDRYRLDTLDSLSQSQTQNSLSNYYSQSNSMSDPSPNPDESLSSLSPKQDINILSESERRASIAAGAEHQNLVTGPPTPSVNGQAVWQTSTAATESEAYQEFLKDRPRHPSFPNSHDRKAETFLIFFGYAFILAWSFSAIYFVDKLERYVGKQANMVSQQYLQQSNLPMGASATTPTAQQLNGIPIPASPQDQVNAIPDPIISTNNNNSSEDNLYKMLPFLFPFGLIWIFSVLVVKETWSEPTRGWLAYNSAEYSSCSEMLAYLVVTIFVGMFDIFVQIGYRLKPTIEIRSFAVASTLVHVGVTSWGMYLAFSPGVDSYCKPMLTYSTMIVAIIYTFCLGVYMLLIAFSFGYLYWRMRQQRRQENLQAKLDALGTPLPSGVPPPDHLQDPNNLMDNMNYNNPNFNAMPLNEQNLQALNMQSQQSMYADGQVPVTTGTMGPIVPGAEVPLNAENLNRLSQISFLDQRNLQNLDSRLEFLMGVQQQQGGPGLGVGMNQQTQQDISPIDNGSRRLQMGPNGPIQANISPNSPGQDSIVSQ